MLSANEAIEKGRERAAANLAFDQAKAATLNPVLSDMPSVPLRDTFETDLSCVAETPMTEEMEAELAARVALRKKELDAAMNGRVNRAVAQTVSLIFGRASAARRAGLARLVGLTTALEGAVVEVTSRRARKITRSTQTAINTSSAVTQTATVIRTAEGTQTTAPALTRWVWPAALAGVIALLVIALLVIALLVMDLSAELVAVVV